MAKYELITIDEDTLENVSLTEDELNSINSKLLKQIENLSKSNPKLNLNTSLPNICESISITKNPSSSHHGIANENILIDLILKAIEADMQLPPEDILFKGFFLAGGGNEFKLTIINPAGFSYYYQVYQTKTDLIVYSLGLHFNPINKCTIPLTSIKSASIFDTLPDGKKIGHNCLTLKLNPKFDLYINSYQFVSLNTKDDTLLNKFLSSLREKEVAPIIRKISKTTIYFYISMIIVLIYYINELFFK